jgi:hypothetical protein
MLTQIGEFEWHTSLQYSFCKALFRSSLESFCTMSFTRDGGSAENSWTACQVGGSGAGSSVVGKPLKARDCAFVRAYRSLNRNVLI